MEPPAISVVHGQTKPGAITTPTQLPANPCRTVSLKALNANAGVVWVGGSAVTNASGYPLNAKDAIDLSVDNVSLLYVTIDSAGDGVAWLVLD